MLNQLIRHKCLSVVFPPLPGVGRCQQRGAGGAEPSLPGGSTGASPLGACGDILGIKLNFLAVPLARGCPRGGAWDRLRGCSAWCGGRIRRERMEILLSLPRLGWESVSGLRDAISAGD